VIILDTNVLSELTHDRPETRVVEWVDAQPVSEVHTTAITVAELVFGVALLGAGRRRRELADRLGLLFEGGLSDRILPFDAEAAVEWGHLRAEHRRAGRSFSSADLQIAAIAMVQGATVVTRNVDDFGHPGLVVVNPWE